MLEFASAVVNRLLDTKFSLPVLLTAVSIYAAFGYALVVESERIYLLALPVLILAIAIEFLLSRQIGGANDHERGSVSKWFGWSILAAIPPLICLLIISLVLGNEIGENFSLAEALAIVIGSTLAIPISAISVGRAIKADGLNFSALSNHFIGHFNAVFLGGILLLLAPQLLSELFLFNLFLDNPTKPAAIVFGILYALFMLMVRILTMSISAEVYRSAEAAQSNEPIP